MASTESIWQEFGDRLKGYIARRIDDPDDADDILQEVFQKIHASTDGLDRIDRVEPWVFRIARNAIADFYRARRAAPASDPLPAELKAEEPDPPPDPLLSCLRPIVDDLPEPYREAIRLVEFEGVSQKELAARLGLSPSGAKSRVQRGRRMIRDVLLACCHFEFDARGGVIDYRRRAEGCKYCRST